ncbi:UNVERIFIED_CONTAM: hypothetical protein RMT77_007004 [Armadillidium vulgare]
MDAEILKLGKELGLKEKELIDFFKESQTRAAAEAEKVRAEAEKVRAEAEKVRAEAEKVRAEAEKDRAEAEKVREFELKKIGLQLRLGISNHTTTLNNRNNHRIENFELAPFIDGEDDIYRYVEDFEYYAQINKWNPNNWGIYLATFLTGNALGIYARMPSNEANDYFKLKCALLPKFYNTEVKCRLMKEERNLYDKDNFEIELVKSEHEIVVSHPASGSESFQQMISSQETPMKGEDSFFQPETFDEKEPPSLQDVPFLPALYKWERNEDEIFSPSKVFAEQDEEGENLVTSDVTKRTENALSSKELSNGSLISRKVYMEKNKEKEIERRRTPILEWGKVDTQEAKRKGSSIQITISSKTESQIERTRKGKSELETKEKVDPISLDGKSVVEKNNEEPKYDLHIVKSRDRSLCNEKKAIKRSWLDCEKASQSFSPQNKRDSKDLDKKRVEIQKNNNFSNKQEMCNEKKFYVKVDPKFDDNLREYSTENQGANISNQQRMENMEKFDIHVSPKFGEGYIDVFIKGIAKFQAGEDELFNSQSKRENRRMIDQSYIVISSKEINDFKIRHKSELEEEDSVGSLNIAVVPESVFRGEDVKVESDSHLLFSSSFLSSSRLSSFSGDKEKEIKRKRHNDRNDDERHDSNYKCDKGTANKRFIIQRIRRYKYRRKGEVKKY